jgi:hypothetical protein
MAGNTPLPPFFGCTLVLLSGKWGVVQTIAAICGEGGRYLAVR